ncbi:MAG: hypothetical protein QOI91_1735 [Solirubrobacteraceae bacterium]|jgi:EAL domain-containing protein (putative c-di-GMP-specific phosphodiesterase class I)|nr:hypothetical protein [Solirubrobacteraceae bacterium]
MASNPSLPRPAARALVASAAAIAFYWLALALHVDSKLVTHGLYLLLMAVPTALIVLRAARHREDRLAWTLMAVGVTLWTLGSVWQVTLDLRGGTLPFPSLSDALWLALYPFAFASLALLARTRLRRPPLSLAFDALLVTLVIAAAVTAVILPPVIANASELSLFAQVVNFAYPIADTVLVSAAVVGALFVGWRRDGVWALLAAGAAALVAADALWTLQASAGTWKAIMGSNALYVVWPTFVAAAAWTRIGRRGPGGELGEVRVLVAALTAALVALGLLVAAHWADLVEASIVLAAIGLLSGINRQALALAAGVRQLRAMARNRTMLDDFRHALEADELTLHFQPLIDAGTGAVKGAEALIRWPREDGLVAPDRFLPAVERSDLIAGMTDFVVDRALSALAGWRREGHDIGVSVNLAAANLSDAGLPGRIAAALARHDLPAQVLTVEVTETAALDGTGAPDRVVAELDALGVELSVDDFGTGHSSLARLARFPIDEVKVDRSFVKDLSSSERPIVATTIQLAHALNLRVVAEGVEDAAMLNALRGLGCDVAQGYFVARPMPAEELSEWLALRAIGGAEGLADNQRVQALLGQLVADLGMDAAFVAEFVDGHEIVRAVGSAGDAGVVAEGVTVPLHETYCQRVVTGVFPNVIPDAQEDALTRDLAITRASGVGAYVGIPLHHYTGELYGTLCCVSHDARPELDERAVLAAQRVAERLRPLLEDANLTLARRRPQPAAG